MYLLVVILLCLGLGSAGDPQDPQEGGSTVAPFRYVDGRAFHILPETHNNESGYFSLCEGLDGSIYVGTCKYGENSYLVEFDLRHSVQRIVLDTHQLCGLTAAGYAAQAKLHTRNDVGLSGSIYVGSKQGYRLDENDTSEYPGGYVMRYDPRVDGATNLGMPYPGQGVIDVVADESRDLLYVVTCEDQHWMLGSTNGGPYRELGPRLTPYATTLIREDGQAFAITHDFQLARYNPASQQVDVRPILVDGQRWRRTNDLAIPTWVLTSDRRRAYLILLNDTRLLEFDLMSEATDVATINHGKMLEGNNPDSRCGLDLGGDGNVYAAIRIDNQTGFGAGYLHHLVRFVPATGAMEDLGVLKVENPDFFDWEQTDADGNPPKWTHGFHRLPDNALTPLHVHMALQCTRDNTIYVTIIYPFTLLQIDAFRVPDSPTAADRVLERALQHVQHVETQLPQYTRVAEIIADRHLAGGALGFPFIQQPLAQDLWGRSGGMVHIGFERIWKPERTESEKANDVAIVGYEADPADSDLETLHQLKKSGVLLIGFGPARRESLQPVVQICDHWFDTGGEVNSSVAPAVSIAEQAAANSICGNTLIAELVGALTRRGKMPTMWKSYSYDDGRDWGDRYFLKKQFHDDFQIAPLPPGELGRRFLRQIRFPIRRLQTQADELTQAAHTLRFKIAAGEKISIVWQGHMPPMYIGRGSDAPWAVAVELHPFLSDQVKRFRTAVPDSSTILSLGYHGLDPIAREVWEQKNLSVIHLCGDHELQGWGDYQSLLQQIDLGFAFGDACVGVDGYPIRLFAPSGIAQALAYAAIQAEIDVSGLAPDE